MTRRAAEILEILAERRTVETRVMIVVAHPDDETIGMGAQLCRFHDALLLEVTDGAPRDVDGGLKLKRGPAGGLLEAQPFDQDLKALAVFGDEVHSKEYRALLHVDVVA